MTACLHLHASAQNKCEINFSAHMKKMIEAGDWLTDEHMSLAQEILKHQFSHIDGWQSTLLVQINGFIPSKGEAIQIHLVSDSHWVTSSSLGGKVNVYDSRKYKGHLSSTLTHQLCQVYRTLIEHRKGKQNAYLAVHIPQVQRQSGSNDCGVFAIAFALHAALGQCIGELTFDQSKMRKHLLECFEAGILTPFPIVEKKATKQAESCFKEKIEVFCTCMMPETYGDMVQCCTCQKWYHLKCSDTQIYFRLKKRNGIAFHALDLYA